GGRGDRSLRAQARGIAGRTEPARPARGDPEGRLGPSVGVPPRSWRGALELEAPHAGSRWRASGFRPHLRG
ncbi:MAG: hypothetical protein ACK55I_38075, partial [bacterium]